MKVLHILGELNPSGAETMLAAASSFWVANGVKSDILSIGEQVGSFREDLHTAGYRIYHIRFKKRPSYFFQVAKLLLAEHYDVIHIHPERGYFAHALLASLLGRPVVVRSIHNCFVYTRPKRIIRSFQRRIVRLLGVQQIAVSQSVSDNEAKQLHNPVPIIENWINSLHFFPPSTQQKHEARNQLGLPLDAIVIVSVSNASDVKNQEAILHSLSRLEDNDEIVYLNVGKTRSYELDLAKRLSLEDNVRFYGSQSDPRLFYWASDIFVMPSLYEGAGIAAMEAIACALIPVLSDVPGLRDLKHLAGLYSIWTGTDSDSVGAGLRAAIRALRMSEPDFANDNIRAIASRHSIEIGAMRYYQLYTSTRLAGVDRAD